MKVFIMALIVCAIALLLFIALIYGFVGIVYLIGG